MPNVESPERFPTACDSFVATGKRSGSGATIFAKNSDRPSMECQPLVSLPAADHPTGSRLECQYIEVEQARHTYAVLGSQPYWLWGFEHGLNECGVVVGNHTIFTKDPVASLGLLGMDLVRIALERSSSAQQAVEVVTGLVERYGQGGSGFADVDWPYHNSFLVADADGAWLLEVSAGNWALKEIREAGGATNHTTIHDDWDRISKGCLEHAREMGWWPHGDEARFDFASAYRDSSTVPESVSAARYARSCATASKSSITTSDIRALMRDHNDGKDYFTGEFTPDQDEYFGVCAHGGGMQTTTASMIVEYPQSPGELLVYWGALASPCMTPYLPLFLEGELPGELSRGGETATAGGMWWRLKELQAVIEQDLNARAPVAREFWRGLEGQFLDSARRLQAELSLADEGQRGDTAADKTTALMAEAMERTEAGVDHLLLEFGAA